MNTAPRPDLNPLIPPPPSVEPRPPQRRSSPLLWLSLCSSVLALTLSGYALFRTLPLPTQEDPALQPEAEAPPVVFEEASPESLAPSLIWREKEVPIFESVAVNSWDEDAFVRQSNGQLTYETEALTAIPGIDVSSHQGEIDWEKVADSGMEFAMIRAGYRGYGTAGKLRLDDRFHENIRGASAAGLDVGVYFFSQATSVWEVEEELELLLDAIRGYKLTYPVVFDWERVASSRNPRTEDVKGTAISRMADFFCYEVTQAGYTPAIYFNQDMAYLELDLDRLDEYPFWLAEYDSSPGFYYHFDLWQYSSKGRIPGIEGYVDLNLSFRDFAAEQA